MFISPAFAQAAPAAASGSSAMGLFNGILPLILIFAVFYFLLIRPQQKAQKSHRAKLAAVLRSASEELLAEGDAQGARIAVDALKELRQLEDSEPSSKP